MIVDITKGIKCGGFDYTVDLSETARQVCEGNDNNGECHRDRHLINLRNDLEPTLLSKTFIHEAIEAVNFIYCDAKIEHEKIQQLSFGLHQVLESLGVRFGKTGSP